MEFFTRFNPAPPVNSDTVGESLTQQSFKDDCDINVIIQRYQESPRPDAMSVSGPRVPLWGDFSSVPNLQQAHAFFSRAEASFAALPSAVRLRFGNDPLQMLAFAQTATPEQLREVFGGQAPLKQNTPQVITPVSGVSEVNKETVEKNT